MDQKIVSALNQLNQDFYQQIAVSFDQTRQSAWRGWERLLPTLNQLSKSNSDNSFSVLDLGCGNGRFADFLLQNHFSFSYRGVDSNTDLLSIAQKKFDLHLDISFSQLDLVKLITTNQLQLKVNHKYELIVAFGVLHHIPSFELRSKFIKTICELLKNNNSRVIVATWQFALEERFNNKFIDPKIIGLDSDSLEDKDFILGWQNQPDIYRYCHFIDQQEMEKIVKVVGNCTVESSFLADGKTEKLNRYFVLQPKQ